MAETSLLGIVFSDCSGDEQDLSSATSIFKAFCSQLPTSAPPQLPIAVTNPTQWPSFTDQRGCAQGVLEWGYAGVENDIGCSDWTCVCNHFYIAQTSLLEMVFSDWSGGEQDVSSATSILDAFCSQLPGVTPVTASPTAALAGGAGTAPTCNNSKFWWTNLL
jgi:hypothetical protein